MKMIDASNLSVQTRPELGERGIIEIDTPPRQAEDSGQPLLPFVLAIHGGGWHNGDRHSYAWLIPRLLPHGLAVVRCSYRPAQVAPFPAAYEDVLALLDWLQKHAPFHGLDPDRCVLLGGSAGGHLATLVATHGVRQFPDLQRLRGVAAFAPVVDMRAQYEHDLVRGQDIAAKFMAGTPTERPAAYDDASPLRNLHPRVPPLWIMHGDADPVVPHTSSVELVHHLREPGNRVEYHQVAGLNHAMVTDQPGAGLKLVHEAEALKFILGVLSVER